MNCLFTCTYSAKLSGCHRQRQEMELRLRKEEEDRQQRRKRVELIMARTRAKGGTPSATPTKVSYRVSRNGVIEKDFTFFFFPPRTGQQ